jgi:hypothetical protein
MCPVEIRVSIGGGKEFSIQKPDGRLAFAHTPAGDILPLLIKTKDFSRRHYTNV